MYVNYYKFNKDDQCHKLFFNRLKNLCKKYNVNPIPEVESCGVEDANSVQYIMNNGMRLHWEGAWCKKSMEDEFKLYVTLDKEAWLNHVNPYRHEEEKRKKEIETLKVLPKIELLKKIQEQKDKEQNIQQELDSVKTNNSILDDLINPMPSSKEMGLSFKLLSVRMKLSILEDIYGEI